MSEAMFDVVIACGTRPAHHPTVPIDGRRVAEAYKVAGLDGLNKL